MDIAGAGGHIDDEISQLIPEYGRNELPDARLINRTAQTTDLLHRPSRPMLII